MDTNEIQGYCWLIGMDNMLGSSCNPSNWALNVILNSLICGQGFIESLLAASEWFNYDQYYTLFIYFKALFLILLFNLFFKNGHSRFVTCSHASFSLHSVKLFQVSKDNGVKFATVKPEPRNDCQNLFIFVILRFSLFSLFKPLTNLNKEKKLNINLHIWVFICNIFAISGIFTQLIADSFS